MNLVSFSGSTTGVSTLPEKTRGELLDEKRIIPVYNLDFPFLVSLRIGTLLGRFSITRDTDTSRLLENEKGFFTHLPDAETVPTGGVIELWTPTPGGNGEFIVTKYKRLK